MADSLDSGGSKARKRAAAKTATPADRDEGQINDPSFGRASQRLDIHPR